MIGILAVVAGGSFYVVQNNNLNQEKENNSNQLSSSSSQNIEYQQKMDVNQLLAGDYSSVVGTWENQRGQELVFTDQGLATQSVYTQDVTLSNGQITNGFYHAAVLSSRLSFIPAGVSNNTDASDLSRDRMVITQNGLVVTEDNLDTVFYKVS